MNVTDYRTQVILEYLKESQYSHAEFCDEYGEPGYHSPKKGIILYNWNDLKISATISDYLEEAGYSLEWSDEWIIDYDYGKAYRTRPDCYQWQPSFSHTEYGDLLTPDDDFSEWIAEYEVTDYNQPIKALPDHIADNVSLESEGYTIWEPDNPETYQTGFHAGMNDNPEKVARMLWDTVDNVESLVFVLIEQSQFYCEWQVWYKTTD